MDRTDRSRSRRALLRAAGAAGLLALAGCSGGGSGGSGGPYGGWLADANGLESTVDRTGAREVRVAVGAGSGLAFDPAAVRVDPGTTVVWEWTGRGGSHNVVHRGGAFESDLAAAEGTTFTHAFDSAGVFKYFCEPHRTTGMKGVVEVG